jgi:hypothetical protein
MSMKREIGEALFDAVFMVALLVVTVSYFFLIAVSMFFFVGQFPAPLGLLAGLFVMFFSLVFVFSLFEKLALL